MSSGRFHSCRRTDSRTRHEHPEAMRKLFLIIMVPGLYAVGLGCPSSVAAQTMEIGGWVGYSVSNEYTSGFGICNVNGCYPSSSNPHYSRTAPAAGLVVRAAWSERLALRGELMLSHRGYGPGEAPHRQRVASRYLELPLLAELHLAKVGPAGVAISGGVAPALLLSCSYSGRRSAGPVTAGCGETDPLTGRSYGPDVGYDLGWILAPGLRFPVPRGSVSLELRHRRGLVDIRSDYHGRTANRATVLTLGFTRRLSH